jgi:hypothetical protein
MVRSRKSGSVSVDKLIAELSRLDARRRDIVAAIKNAIAPLGASLEGAGGLLVRRTGRRPGFKMSAAAKAKIAAAQRARWARVKKQGS